MSAILRAERITKKFPGVVALRDVSFDLRAGEIHALCGENGAGKSTLIKLLSGLHPRGSFEGELFVDEKPAAFRSLADAERAGIAVICQELALVEEMSVAENIFLGSEPRTRAGFIDWPKIWRDARALLEKFKVEIDCAARVVTLGVGQKQLVEIVKAIGKDSRILILDEPTAALAEHEVIVLLDIVRDLRRRGIACIYISHKLDEVFAIADRITVLRDGASIVTRAASETTKAEVIKQMVGREIADLFPRRARVGTPFQGVRTPGSPENDRAVHTPGRLGKPSLPDPLLEVHNLTVADPHTRKTFLEDISLSVRAGEVLGIGGLMGAGRTELLMHLFGAWGRRLGGTVKLEGRVLRARSPHEILRSGIALVSEDRRRFGLVLDQSVGFNLSLSSLSGLTRNGFIDSRREFRRSDHFFQSLRVKAPGLEAVAGKLSGGNQQKVVLGKALMTEPRVIFLDEPTRGIDVGAKLEIYEIINQLTEAGKAVVLVSSELPELIGMSDRIVMLHEGRIGGEFARADATQEKLMAAAMGRQHVELV